MLYVYFGAINPNTDPPEYIWDIDTDFDNCFEDAWTSSGFAKRVIKEIDSSDLVGTKVVDSPWLGVIPITSISGGAKNLILAENMDGIALDGDNFGDNCYTLLHELAKKKAIYMNLTYFADPKDIPKDFKAYVINTGEVVVGPKEFTRHHSKHKCNEMISFDSVDWGFKPYNEVFHPDLSFLEQD